MGSYIATILGVSNNHEKVLVQRESPGFTALEIINNKRQTI